MFAEAVVTNIELIYEERYRVPVDTLVIWKLDRLGRSLRHLVNTVGGLTARGIGRRFKNDTERLESCSSSTLG